MDCSKPDGCPPPLDCSKDGCCNEQYVIETHELERANEYTYESVTFDRPLALVVQDLQADVASLMAAVNLLNSKLS